MSYKAGSNTHTGPADSVRIGHWGWMDGPLVCCDTTRGDLGGTWSPWWSPSQGRKGALLLLLGSPRLQGGYPVNGGTRCGHQCVVGWGSGLPFVNASSGMPQWIQPMPPLARPFPPQVGNDNLVKQPSLARGARGLKLRGGKREKGSWGRSCGLGQFPSIYQRRSSAHAPPSPPAPAPVGFPPCSR